MAIANYVYSSGFVKGELITERHFGSAFENRKLSEQSIEDGSVWRQVEDRLDLKYIRFPGGAQTENFFDLENPDNEFSTGYRTGATNHLTKMSDFFDFAISEGMSVSIVIPTWRYFDTATKTIKPGTEAILKKFVTDVNNGVYGDVDVAAYEIGNEWFDQEKYHWTEGGVEYKWTAAQFGELQARFVGWIDQANQASGKDIDIWVQTNQDGDVDHDDNGFRDNIEILQAMTTAELQAVDGVVDHFYLPAPGATIFDATYFFNSDGTEKLLVASNRI